MRKRIMYTSGNIQIAGATISNDGRFDNRARAEAGRRTTREQASTGQKIRAEAPEAREIVHGLEEFLSDGTPVLPAAHIVAASRAFSAGNGFLTGQIVDHSA